MAPLLEKAGLIHTARDSWDGVVIGAGPAGSIAAREMARRGMNVLLIDKSRFPRTKVCGCCLNGNALAALRRLGLSELPDNLGAIPLTRMVLAANHRSAELTLPGGVSLSRSAFDAALIHEAVNAGVTFQPGVFAQLGDAVDQHREVILDHSKIIAASVVIVADGLASRATADRRDDSDSMESRIGAGVVLDHAPADYALGCIYMATARHGYVGLVRIEDGRLDIAAAFDTKYVKTCGGPGQAARQVLSNAGLSVIPDLEDAGWKGTPPLTRQPRVIVGKRWFAVGDAAGYVEPFTGEGMAWAINGATAAADLAARAATCWSDAFQSEWQALHARLVGARQRFCRIAARVLRSPLLCQVLVRALALAPGLAGPFIRRVNHPTRFVPCLAPGVTTWVSPFAG